MVGQISPIGALIPWQDSRVFSPNRRHQRAYEALVANLREIPAFNTPTEKQTLYFEDSAHAPTQIVWQFVVPGQAVSSRWTEIHPRFAPTKAFEVKAGMLAPRPGPPPASPRLGHRILVRSNSRQTAPPSFFGSWNADNAYLLQHEWHDGTPLLNTSTAQLRNLQALRRLVPHPAFYKWEATLGCNVPATVRQNTWLSYRGLLRIHFSGNYSI